MNIKMKKTRFSGKNKKEKGMAKRINVLEGTSMV